MTGHLNTMNIGVRYRRKYDDMYVYGIGMEECPHVEKMWMDVQYETVHRKQMVIVLSNQPREDLRTE